MLLIFRGAETFRREMQFWFEEESFIWQSALRLHLELLGKSHLFFKSYVGKYFKTLNGRSDFKVNFHEMGIEHQSF